MFGTTAADHKRIRYTTCKTPEDINGILALQKQNHVDSLSQEEKHAQGFVTLAHSYGQLEVMNNAAQHVIAKVGPRVVAYVLAMTPEFENEFPLLKPMFELFTKIRFRGTTIADSNYIVVGQTCVDKSYRGRGLVRNCFDLYRLLYAGKYEFAVTEIAANNLRSLRAHENIGFKTIDSYKSPGGVLWHVVLWDWR